MSLLGIDIGTSGVKVIILGDDGQIAANVTREYPVSTPKPLWSEQSPEDWWRGVCDAVSEALKAGRVQGSDIKGIGVSGQMVGLVVLDSNHTVLRPCIMWNDQRSVREAEELTERIGLEFILEETSNPMFASFVAPKIEWIRRNEPAVFQKIRHVLLPKDYIVYRLTGRLATEVSDASGTCLFDVEKRRWSDGMIAAMDIRPEWLPDCFESDEIVGRLSQDAAAEANLAQATPVVAGAGDQPAQSLGSGIVRPGLCGVTIGTSGVVFAQSDRHIKHPEGLLHGFCHSVHGQWYVMGVMLAAGGSFQWLRDTLSARTPVSYDELTELAAGVPPGSEGLVYLPYLSGERVPYNNPLARAGWIGLTQRHGLAHMIRAVMEGISFGLYDSVRIIRELGMDIDCIYASGGAAGNEMWRQMLADIFNIEIATTNVTEGAAFGAAMLAGIGVGVYANAEQAAEALIRFTSSNTPDPDTRDSYEKAYTIYTGLYPKIEPFFSLMADVGTGTEK